MKKLIPRHPNENDFKPTDNCLVVSDIHGDLTGFLPALKLAHWNPDTQRLISLGDEWDRGPQSRQVSDFMTFWGAIRIQSNHGWKHARYAHHEKIRQETGKKNPIKPSVEMQDTIDQFTRSRSGSLSDIYSDRALAMLDDPAYLPFEDSQGKGILVHAGINPYQKIHEQDTDKMLVRRFHPSPDKFLAEETPEYQYWQKSYHGYIADEGPFLVIHGHSVCSSPTFHNNPWVLSIDQAGVIGTLAPWGGKHTILKLGSRETFSVPGSQGAEAHYREIIAKKKRASLTELCL